ncbi:MAG: hypothetical protein EBZ48_12730 [Proteobacteria bacterium]|nr:hypothetical protein [Pseudomonadota bacterium]
MSGRGRRRVVERLKAAGVSEVIINLHHRGEEIKAFVSKRGSFGITVHFSEEASLLGTGGGLKQAADFLKNEPYFFVHNSDVYSEISLQGMLAQHQASAAVATLAVMARPTDRALLFDLNGEFLGYENKKAGERVMARQGSSSAAFGFSGIQVCSPRLFQYMQGETGEFSTIRVYMNAARAGDSVRAFLVERDYWIDMGTPQRLEELRKRLQG